MNITRTGIGLGGGGRAETTEGELGVTREREILEGIREQELLGLNLGLLDDLLQAGSNVQEGIYEKSVAATLDIKVAEKEVRLEEHNSLVANIILVCGSTKLRSVKLRSKKLLKRVRPRSSSHKTAIAILAVEGAEKRCECVTITI
jgi:hypothetical protein